MVPVGKSAYETAWESLDDDAKQRLSKGTSVRNLFTQLDQTDQQKQAET